MNNNDEISDLPLKNHITALTSDGGNEKTPADQIFPGEKNLLETVFNNARIGIAFLNIDNKILDANNELVKIFGYSKEELLYIELKELMPPEEFQKDITLFEEVYSGLRNHFSLEKKFIKKDKTFVYIRLTLFRINTLEKENINFAAFMEDITEREKISEELSEEQTLLSALLHGTTDNIYFKDLNSRFIKVNEATANKLGFSNPDELVGKSDFDIFGPSHANDAFIDEQKILLTSQAIINKEEKEEWPDGRITWAETSKQPFFNEDGIIKGIMGITRDITDKKKSELISEVLYKISEAIYSADNLDNLYSIIHQSIQTLMPAKNFYIALYDEKRELISFPYFVDEIDSVPTTKKLGRGLTECVLRNGKALLVDEELDKKLVQEGEIDLVGSLSSVWLGIPLKIKNKTIGVIVVQDYKNPKAYGEDDMQLLTYISEQIARVIENKINSEKIKKFTDELIEINHTKDKFFSIIAHDLRSPFNGLLGLIEILTDSNGNLSADEREEYTNMLSNLLKNQYELLQNLLEWAAMQLGKTIYEPTKLHLFKLVEKKIELFGENAHKKNITIQNELAEDTMAIGDSHMVGSVLQNFISNAIKFTGRNGVIKIYSAKQGKYLEVTIEDNGVGMNKGTLENIFRLDSVHTSKGTEGELGTGLGIMLCRDMIEKQGGQIKISSEVNIGTKVSFTLVKS